MRYFVKVGEGGRIEAVKPEFITSTMFDAETGGMVEVDRPNISEADEGFGFIAWPFERDIPENYYEHAIVDGDLVHIGPPPPTAEELRASEVNEAHDDLPEIQEGLMEVARMSADHETSIEDLENAIIELAALIGGE